MTVKKRLGVEDVKPSPIITNEQEFIEYSIDFDFALESPLSKNLRRNLLTFLRIAFD